MKKSHKLLSDKALNAVQNAQARRNTRLRGTRELSDAERSTIRSCSLLGDTVRELSERYRATLRAVRYLRIGLGLPHSSVKHRSELSRSEQNLYSKRQQRATLADPYVRKLIAQDGRSHADISDEEVGEHRQRLLVKRAKAQKP